MALLPQPTPSAASASLQGTNGVGVALAGLAYVAAIAIALGHLDGGGLEALAAAAMGLISGATSVFSKPDQRSLSAKLEQVLDTSFAAMWAGFILAGVLHVPLHNFFEAAFSAWR